MNEAASALAKKRWGALSPKQRQDAMKRVRAGRVVASKRRGKGKG